MTLIHGVERLPNGVIEILATSFPMGGGGMVTQLMPFDLANRSFMPVVSLQPDIHIGLGQYAMSPEGLLLVPGNSRWDAASGRNWNIGDLTAIDCATGKVVPTPRRTRTPSLRLSTWSYGRNFTSPPAGMVRVEGIASGTLSPALCLGAEILLPGQCAAHPRGFWNVIRHWLLEEQVALWSRKSNPQQISDRLGRLAQVRAVDLQPADAEPVELQGDISVTVQNNLGLHWTRTNSNRPATNHNGAAVAAYVPMATRLPLDLYPLSETECLVEQQISPTPPAINKGRGIVRFGIVTVHSRSVDWRGWIPLPAHVRWGALQGPGPGRSPGEWTLFANADKEGESDDPYASDVFEIHFPTPVDLGPAPPEWLGRNTLMIF